MQKMVGRTVALLVQCRVPYPVAVVLRASVSLSLSWCHVATCLHEPALDLSHGEYIFYLRFGSLFLCSSVGLPGLGPS